MARTKYSERFCGYCNKVTRMEMVGERNDAQSKMWFRCTRCHHSNLIEMTASEKSGQASVLTPETSTHYTPQQSFKIGEAIFHTEWNDVGTVMSKTKTSGGMQAIVVSFEKQGQRTLIENLRPEPADMLENQ